MSIAAAGTALIVIDVQNDYFPTGAYPLHDTQAVLERNGVTVADIALLVPHQANRRINEFVAQKLEIPPEKVIHNIEKYGNTTAASIPLALSEAIGEGRVKEGDLVLFAAFGAGFTWGAGLVRL